MNYKIVIKRNNREVENKIVDLNQLNSCIKAFHASLNIGWKDDNILLHVESTKEKAMTDDEFMEDMLDRMLKKIHDALNEN